MPGFTFTIRKAGAAEAADAFALIEEYYEQVGVMVRDIRAELEHHLSADGSGIWLAWSDSNITETPPRERPIGCILLRPLTSIRDAGEIKRLYVRRPFRGFGVAQALLLALEKYAAAHGIVSLYLDSKQDLQAAIRFYERSGYCPCERYNDNPQATIFMRKQLL